MTAPPPHSASRYAERIHTRGRTIAPVRRLVLISLVPTTPGACSNCLGWKRLWCSGCLGWGGCTECAYDRQVPCPACTDSQSLQQRRPG